MRYILIILLFISQVVYGQVVVSTHYGGVSTNNNASYSFFPPAGTIGNLLIAFVINTEASPATPTLSGNGTTFDQIATVVNGGVRVTAFRGIITASTANITVDFGGVSQTGVAIMMVKVTGYDPSGSNGSGAIVQTTDNTGTSSNPSIPITVTPHNSVLTGVANSTNPFNATTNGTELYDLGYATPTTGGYVTFKKNASPTITKGTSTTWGGIAIELVDTKRRIFGAN